MSQAAPNLTVAVVALWERQKRWAHSMGLSLSFDPIRMVFVIREADGKVVASNLDTPGAINRILTMYHRLGVRFGDFREDQPPPQPTAQGQATESTQENPALGPY